MLPFAASIASRPWCRSRLLRSGIVVAAVLLTPGCALVEHLKQQDAGNAATQLPGDVTTAETLIATDFVNALVQFDTKQPQATLIELAPPDSGFAEAMAQRLAGAGYTTRQVASPTPGVNWFDYEITALGPENDGLHRTYLVSVGEIKLKRNYFFQPQGVSPNSSLFVKGADASRLVLDDGLFEQGTPLTVVSAAANESVAETANGPGTGPMARADITPAAPAEKVSVPGDVPITVAPNIAQAAATQRQDGRAIALYGFGDTSNPFLKQNMVALDGDSNFSSVFGNYVDVSRETLIFPNDSLRLGARGKQQLLDMVDDFDASSDIFSVIGCSLGRTSIAQGNEMLATGRARRVVEALLFVGVPRESIFDEGCWAGRAFDDELPRRGVVVTLKRERPNS